MKILTVEFIVAALVAVTGLACAQSGGGAKAEGAVPACIKMPCPCLLTQGLTLTAEQKAKVDVMQAKCKNGCSEECHTDCAKEMKEILTPEQQKQWQKNMAAAMKGQGGCCTAPK